MNITKNNLYKAVEAKILSKKQADDLVDFITHLPNQAPSFNLTNVLYYLGGLIAIGAMSLFMNLGWEYYGSWGIFVLSFFYVLLGLALAQLFAKKGELIPAGICATFVIALTPLAIYGFQQGMGWWPDDQSYYQNYHTYIKWHWIFMELGTLIVGLILCWLYAYPFMVMPIAVTLWYMSMDLTSMLTGGNYDFTLATQVSTYFGFLTIALAFWVDIRSAKTQDYAFWLYIFGVLTFWGGISAQYSDSELAKFFYLCLNLIMILIGVILNRKVFVVFGALGTCFYLGYLAFQVFQFSLLFPIVLTVIGFAIIYLGILWQKNETSLTLKMRSFLPKALQDLLEARE